MSPSDHNTEVPWDRIYSLSSLSEKTRISYHLEMSLQRQQTANSRKAVGKKRKSARNKTERWSGYSLEFCILA